jgi:excisionase family DNA binding protein
VPTTPEPLVIDGWSFENPLTPAQVAALYGVTDKTVARWADDGRLTFIRTPGGTRRYSRAQVEHIMRGESGGAK